jgi:hypothetical protein
VERCGAAPSCQVLKINCSANVTLKYSPLIDIVQLRCPHFYYNNIDKIPSVRSINTFCCWSCRAGVCVLQILTGSAFDETNVSAFQ